jgi:hypothetical protein
VGANGEPWQRWRLEPGADGIGIMIKSPHNGRFLTLTEDARRQLDGEPWHPWFAPRQGNHSGRHRLRAPIPQRDAHRPVGGEPHDLAIEVKYLRSHPSGSQSARPMHYGQLLADFNKVTQVAARLRLIVLAADDGYVRYVEQSARSVLPLKAGETALITPSSLGRLADTPRQQAESHGP